MSSRLTCSCGKKKNKLNEKNWNRHIMACEVDKLKRKKICSNISRYITQNATQTASTSSQGKIIILY